MISDPRFEPRGVGAAEPPRMRQLQTDEQVIGRAESLAMRRGSVAASAARPGRCSGVANVWRGLARPAGMTAAASPPQISLAPLQPKFRQRWSVKSEGLPS